MQKRFFTVPKRFWGREVASVDMTFVKYIRRVGIEKSYIPPAAADVKQSWTLNPG